MGLESTLMSGVYVARSGNGPSVHFQLGSDTFVRVPVSESGKPLCSTLIQIIKGGVPGGLSHDAASNIARGLVVVYDGHPTIALKVYEAVVKPGEMDYSVGKSLARMSYELRELYAPAAALD